MRLALCNSKFHALGIIRQPLLFLYPSVPSYIEHYDADRQHNAIKIVD